MPYTQIFGTQNNDIKTTNATSQDIVLLLAGDDIVNCDFKTADYIIGGDGQDTLVTGGAFKDFSIELHPILKDIYVIKSSVTGKINVVKSIESFRFNEGDASLEDFMGGISPAPAFDTTVTLGQFQNDAYNAENGVSEQFLIDLSKWNMSLKIDGFNVNEDQLVVVSSEYTTAADYIKANPTGVDGTWGVDGNGQPILFTPEFQKLSFANIVGLVGKPTLAEAESAGWIKFGQVESPVTAIAVNFDEAKGSYTAIAGTAENITVDLTAWTKTLTLTYFDIAQDTLIIDTHGLYTTAAKYIAANPTGESGTWGITSAGQPIIFTPNFQQITFASTFDLVGTPTLVQAETEGWVKFI